MEQMEQCTNQMDNQEADVRLAQFCQLLQEYEMQRLLNMASKLSYSWQQPIYLNCLNVMSFS